MQTIADKIAKLIAKADSTTHPEEADAFMAKAQQLLEAHGLSLMELGRLTEDPIGRTEEAYVSSDGWKDKIAFPLARLYGAKLITTPHTRASKAYVVFGRESARMTFAVMAPFVFKQAAALANAEYKAGAYASPNIARTAIASALAMRIYDMLEETTAKHEGTGVNALVPVDLIQREIEERFPSLRTSRYRLRFDNNAVRAASKVSLHRQTAGTAQRRIAG